MDDEKAQRAFRRGDFAAALPLLNARLEREPGDVEAQLLLARCFLGGGQVSTAFQVLKALVETPRIRRHVPLPKKETDELFVEILKRWAADLAEAGFPRDGLEDFSRAVDLYEKLPGERALVLRGLRDDLRLKRPRLPEA